MSDMIRRGLLTLLALVVWSPCFGQPITLEPARLEWLEGPQLERQLDLPMGIEWSGVPLRKALNRLGRDAAQGRRIAIILDRRVDPDQKVNLELSDVSLRDILEHVARDRKLGISILGPVVYLGPPQAAERLRTLSALREKEVRRLPMDRQKEFLRRNAWQWDDLATPRQLLGHLSDETGLRIEGVAQVPHDLWPSAQWPPLTLADRLTLLGVGFDLTFVIADDGRSVELIPIAEPVQIRRRYPAKRWTQSRVQSLRERLPEAELSLEGGRLTVTGRVEEHEIVSSALKGAAVVAGTPRATRPETGEKRYTLRVKEQPVGAVVRQICRHVGLDCTLDQAAITKAGISLERRVTFQVRGATLAELLSAILDPVGLAYRLDGQRLEIGPALR